MCILRDKSGSAFESRVAFSRSARWWDHSHLPERRCPELQSTLLNIAPKTAISVR